MEHVTREPLAWPVGWKRTPPRERDRTTFTSGGSIITVWKAIQRLRAELQRLNASDVILSTNLRIRLDGWPYSDQKTPDDPGAAVYFRLKKQDRCLACDAWNSVAGNVAALAAHVDALRRIDRYRVGTIEQAFAGYTALPPATDAWWLVFDLPRTATFDQVDARFRELAKVAHPDAGGTHNDMARLTEARANARKALS